MTVILTQARDVNSKLVRTMLKNLEPKGEYKVNTLSNKEIDRVCRKMHADREFMKRQKWLILSWVYIIIISLVCGLGMTLAVLPCLVYLSLGRYDDNYMKLFMPAVSLAFFTKMSLTEFKKCTQNIHKLEEILAMY